MQKCFFDYSSIPKTNCIAIIIVLLWGRVSVLCSGEQGYRESARREQQSGKIDKYHQAYSKNNKHDLLYVCMYVCMYVLSVAILGWYSGQPGLVHDRH